MKHLLSILALTFLVTFASAADQPEPVKPVQPAAAPAVPVKHDYGNEFLGFALEKAKLYSDKGEMAFSKGVDLAVQEAPIVMAESGTASGTMLFTLLSLFLCSSFVSLFVGWQSEVVAKRLSALWWCLE